MTQHKTQASKTPKINIPFGVFLAGAGLFFGQLVAHFLIFGSPGRVDWANPLRFFAEPGGVALLILALTAVWFGVIFRTRRHRGLPNRPRGGVVFATSLLTIPVLTLGPALVMAGQESEYFGTALILYSMATFQVTFVVTGIVTTLGVVLMQRREGNHLLSEAH